MAQNITIYNGPQLIVRVGYVAPNTPFPLATYAPNPLGPTGGLELISAVSNLPTTLYQAASGKTANLDPVKNSQRIKMFNQVASGQMFEIAEGSSGTLSVIMTPSIVTVYNLDEATDLLVKASKSPNAQVYVEEELLIGKVSAVLNRYLHIASVYNVSLAGTLSADAVALEQAFTLTGNGDVIMGYVDK
jgi:hypothetical protein